MAYTVRKRVPEDHRLVIEVPQALDAGSEVEITIEQCSQPAPGSAASLRDLFARWDREGYTGTGRTKEEVDREIRELRDEWDND